MDTDSEVETTPSERIDGERRRATDAKTKARVRRADVNGGRCLITNSTGATLQFAHVVPRAFNSQKKLVSMHSTATLWKLAHACSLS